MKRPLLLALLVCLAVVVPTAAGQVRTGVEATPGSYIVVFKASTVPRAGVPAAARQLAQAHGGSIHFVYRHALEGFAARLSASAAAAVARDSRVAYVERDQVMHIVGTQTPATWGTSFL